MKVGIVSDTHGFLDQRVFPIFEAVELILHAGDIGSEEIITSLEALAPVKAVFGNVDGFPITTRYPEVLSLELGGLLICMIHQLVDLRGPKSHNTLTRMLNKSADVLIYGHTHSAAISQKNERLLFNPGSAGRRRFHLRPSVGLLTISEAGELKPEIVYLDEI